MPPPNKKIILNGISASLEPGDSLAIVGASGCGQSTLARMRVGSAGEEGISPVSMGNRHPTVRWHDYRIASREGDEAC
jgi:ABC-type dipeptide/oligopeptide/nickel transport system ATPase subunit